MKALIFAAGLGSRLKPYTETMPKALVPVAGVPMLEILIRHLKASGISSLIINVHHFAGQIIDFLNKNNNFGIDIAISNEEDCLLDTGGGLRKASWFFADNKPFLVHNVDVISDINLAEMLDFHTRQAAVATLAVSARPSSRYFLFDDSMQLGGWQNTKTGEIKNIGKPVSGLQPFAFSGIHILDPRIFGHMDQTGTFSIVDTYLNLAGRFKISGYRHNPVNWVDMGKPDQLQVAELILKNNKLI